MPFSLKNLLGSVEGLSEDQVQKIEKHVNDTAIELENVRSNLSKKENDMTDIIKTRDGLKEELSVVRKELLNRGTGDEYEKLKKQYLDLESQHNGLKSEYENANKSLSSLQNSIKNDILSKFPENSEERKFAEKISNIEELKSFQILFSKRESEEMDSGKPGDVYIDPSKKYDEYTAKDLEVIEKNNPTLFNKLLKEKYPNN